MYEFETNFTINTGDLSATFTGSGVHLYKDVTMSFGLIDQQLNPVSNDSELISNPLINTVAFDILDINGNTIYPNYKSGTTSRSITITEKENESIFGVYTKDFGVRATVTNHVNNDDFKSEFYVYGNVPEISGFSIVDASGYSFVVVDSGGYSPPNADGYFFSGSGQYDKIIVNMVFSGNSRFVNMTRYDVYISTEDDIVLYSDPTSIIQQNSFFLYSEAIRSVEQINQLTIKPVGLLYDTDYYFKIVPHSSLGTGAALSFGPKRFTRESPIDTSVIVSANQFDLYAGDEVISSSIITGLVNTPSTTVDILDTITSGEFYTALYTSQIKTGNNNYISSELKLVLNDPPSLFESSITNTGQLIYSIDQISDTYYLKVSGVGPNSSFKMMRTTL